MINGKCKIKQKWIKKKDKSRLISKETWMPFKLFPEKNIFKVQWLKFSKIGPKNAEIAVLEQLEPKILFVT